MYVQQYTTGDRLIIDSRRITTQLPHMHQLLSGCVVAKYNFTDTCDATEIPLSLD